MVLSTGTVLGTYEIIAPLGAGGMGEVNRARDTKLGRAVAIKVILDQFASDPERVDRFERDTAPTRSRWCSCATGHQVAAAESQPAAARPSPPI